MLEELHIRDLALVQDVWLEFAPGMTVLTGETGAGKTVLLGGLKLLLGERADSGAVRGGAAEAVVEGRFANDGEELLVRRRVGADGRSRCVIDGEMAAVGGLAERLGPTVDLHGQHDHQALLSPATHGGYLDRWLGSAATDALTAYRAARSAWKESVRTRDELAARVDASERDADHLRRVVSEIDQVGPEPGEDEALRMRLPALQHAERLSEAAGEAAEALRGDDGALDTLGTARAALSRVAGIDSELDSLGERLAEAEALLDDVSSATRVYRDAVEHDPQALDAAMTRLSALTGLNRTYGPSLDDVLGLRDEAHARLAEMDHGTEELSRAAERVAETRSQLVTSAETLELLRRNGAPGFVEALAEAASDLAMEGASYDVRFSELPFDSWTTDGASRIEFLFAAAPGQPPRPLARVASGGEISRVMLALKSVLGTADTVQTLVFDEIDAGIGGSTASAVGRRLAQLALTHQVIVVTHLAQVAAFADRHLVVSKSVDGEHAATTAVEVRGTDRIAEVARMLSGSDSEAGCAHASELLQAAASAVTGR